MSENKIKEPIIIVGCPRSGTSLLHTILSEGQDVYSLYRESQDIFNSFYLKKKIEYKEYNNDSLNENDLNDQHRNFLLHEFHNHTSNFRTFGYFVRNFLIKDNQPSVLSNLVSMCNGLMKDIFVADYKLVEKNPRACFRIPFLKKLFPDAKYIYITRDGRSNISSLIEGWRRPSSHYRIPLPNIPLNIKGYKHKRWRYIVPPGWENYTEKNLEDVCAFQWLSANKYAQEGLKIIDPKKVYRISYEALTDDLENSMRNICEFTGINFNTAIEKLCKKPPIVSSPKNEVPKKDKWLKNKKLLENVYPTIEPMMKELGYSFDEDKELVIN